ncbi:beta-phosphoglucomutase family hydrolase [Nocardia vinacea]|uniref:Beta-phosphoglucomutase n=1 Tax=Nocardia vinacea TaxID=96468 RepID=A0ABZ1Z3E7_9NOCA|nr:beta-phosphoglucomutase family hydrolase [Nocardia vinacea]
MTPSHDLRGLGLPETISVALFDLDGVLTDTAAVHRRAWKAVFDEFLAGRSPGPFHPFTDADYLGYVDGRSRADGIREFLKSRGITLPEGEPDAAEGEPTVHGLGNRKNRLLLSVLERDGVHVYPGSLAYLNGAREAGLRTGVVTASANAHEVLAVADLTRFVDVCIDGVEIAGRGLRGKPAPDAFLAAAEALDAKPEQAAAFEDAIAGVTAGRAADFGYVVGVDRVRDGTQAEALRRAGADVVVTDLAELGPPQ